MLDFKEVDWHAPPVAAAGPLRVQLSRLLVRVDIDGIVHCIDVDGGAPFFRLLELFTGIGLNPAACAQKSEEDGVVVRRGRARLVEALLRQVRLEVGKGSLLLGGQMAQMAVRIAIVGAGGLDFGGWASGGRRVFRDHGVGSYGEGSD